MIKNNKRLNVIKKIICLGVIFVMVFAMVGCNPKEKGTFYSLQEAYDLELLTQDDLESIAYYHNGGNDDENFEPIPKTPENLSEKTKNAIKETRAYNLRTLSSSPVKNAKADDVRIIEYCGTYNNSIAVMIDDAYTGHLTVITEDIIAGVLFSYSSSNSIKIWKEK